MAIAVVHDTYLKTALAAMARLGGDVGERDFRARGDLTADFRGRLTCLFPTQFLLRRGRFSPVFWASERRGLGVV